MNKTVRSITSKIRGLLKLQSPDLVISDRLIVSVLLTINNKIISQQISQRKSWGVESLYTTLGCLEMEEVPLWECCDTQSECKIARSKKDIPDILDSYYQLTIQRVSSIDGKVKFDYLTTPERYSNLLQLYPNLDKRYFFIKNKRLYVTDHEIEKISITAFFSGLVDVDSFSCDGGSDCPKNPLDYDFKTLPKVEEDVVRLTVQEILQTFKQVRSEVTSGDGVEGN